MSSTNACFSSLMIPVVLCNSLIFADIDPCLKQQLATINQQNIQIPFCEGTSSATNPDYDSYSPDTEEVILRNFAEKILMETLPMDSDVAHIVHEHFWDLV